MAEQSEPEAEENGTGGFGNWDHRIEGDIVKAGVIPTRLMLNLTDEEMKQLREAAGDEPPVAFARQIILRYLARRRK